jgi:hypothetical protein
LCVVSLKSNGELPLSLPDDQVVCFELQIYGFDIRLGPLDLDLSFEQHNNEEALGGAHRLGGRRASPGKENDGRKPG